MDSQFENTNIPAVDALIDAGAANACQEDDFFSPPPPPTICEEKLKIT